MVVRNYYFIAHFTERKLNVHEIFLLKRGAKIRLRETGKRVKHIFCLNKTFSLTTTTKRKQSSLITITLSFMAEKGNQCLPVSGTTDFRQITGTFGVSLIGNFLPIQDGVREK